MLCAVNYLVFCCSHIFFHFLLHEVFGDAPPTNSPLCVDFPLMYAFLSNSDLFHIGGAGIIKYLSFKMCLVEFSASLAETISPWQNLQASLHKVV